MISQNGINLVKQFEGCRLKAYRDMADVTTIGWGHTSQFITDGMIITQAQADQFLANDLSVCDACIDHHVTVKLNQNQRDAIADFIFNEGAGHFASSTLLRDLNAGNYNGASAQFLVWDIAAGHHVEQLHERRQAEINLFLS